MKKYIYFISEQCPIGCGEVMVLESKKTGRLFCYCAGCGVAFESPANAQMDSTDFDMFLTLGKISPDGVVLPSEEKVRECGYERWVCKVCKEFEWYSEEELNSEEHFRT